MSIPLVLPYLLFPLVDQIHQLSVKVVLIGLAVALLLLGGLDLLLVRGTGDVASVVRQAHHRHFTHPALVSAVPGEGRR